MLGPNNDFTHTAQGWRLLRKNDRKAARAHFLEALRINPENRWAQNGLATGRSLTLGISCILLSLGLATFQFVTTRTSPRDRTAVFVISAGVAMGFIAAGWLGVRDAQRNIVK